HEELLAGTVLLAHDQVELTAPGPVEIAEARVAVAEIGMRLAVFLPEELEGDATPLELPVDSDEVWERPAVTALRRWIEAGLQGGVVEVVGQGPAQTRRPGPSHDVVHGRAAERAARRRVPQRLLQAPPKPQNLSRLAHGHSCRRHPPSSSPVWDEEGRTGGRPTSRGSSRARWSHRRVFGFGRNLQPSRASVNVGVWRQGEYDRLGQRREAGLHLRRCRLRPTAAGAA